MTREQAEIEVKRFRQNPAGWTDENGMRYRCNRCKRPMISLLPAELTSGACECGGLIEADPRNFEMPAVQQEGSAPALSRFARELTPDEELLRDLVESGRRELYYLPIPSGTFFRPSNSPHLFRLYLAIEPGVLTEVTSRVARVLNLSRHDAHLAYPKTEQTPTREWAMYYLLRALSGLLYSESLVPLISAQNIKE